MSLIIILSMKYFVIFVVVLLVFQQGFSQEIVINEFVSSNETGIQDSDGDYSDWIEIYNASDELINLEGYMLSDEEDLPDKWIFPWVEILPQEFVLVFASNKEDIYPGELHANFKISQSGETLLFSDPQGEIASLVQAVYVPTDQSYGRIRDGETEMLIISHPTPAYSNAESNAVYCSHTSGFYANEFELNLIPSNEDIQIRYTLNGEIPNVNSTLYTQAIVMDNISGAPNNISNIPTTPLEGPWQLDEYIWQEPDTVYKANVLRFASFNDDTILSEIANRTFFVDEEIPNRYTFSLISIITDSLNLFQYDTGIYIPGVTFEEEGWSWVPVGNYHRRGREWERNIHISFFENNGELAFETNAGMRMRGWGSTAFPQKSFGVYFRKEYGLKNIEYPIFPDALSDKYKRLVFRSSGNDFLYTHFRDAVLQNILRPMNFEYQRFSPSVVFINGEYWGIHNMREKYDEYYFDYQYDIDQDSIIILGACGYEDVGSNEDYFELSDYLVNNDISLSEHYNYVKTYLDIQNFIDYEIAEIFYANYDWPCNNHRLWKTTASDSKWRYLIYDLDLSFDFFDDASYDTPSMEHATNDGDEWPYCDCSNYFFKRLLENDDFKEEFISRFAFHLNTTFNSESVIDSINKYKILFEPEMAEQIERWFYPEDMSSWNEQVEKMIYFAQHRPCYMRENIMNFFDLEEFDFSCDNSSTYELNGGHQLTIVPNPSNGKNIHISLLKNKRVYGHYKIFSFDGKIVAQDRVDQNIIKLDLSYLLDGIYYISLESDKQNYVGKIVITH